MNNADHKNRICLECGAEMPLNLRKQLGRKRKYCDKCQPKVHLRQIEAWKSKNRNKLLTRQKEYNERTRVSGRKSYPVPEFTAECRAEIKKAFDFVHPTDIIQAPMGKVGRVITKYINQMAV